MLNSSVTAIWLFLLVLCIVGQPFKKAPVPSFSPDWQLIPSNFVGHDFKSIYEFLFNSKSSLEKDEFETTAQFENRINNRTSIKIGNNLTAANELIFVYRPTDSSLNGLTSKYDADNRLLTITIHMSKYETYKFRSIGADNPKLTLYRTEVTPHSFEKDRSYAAQSAFGVKTVVTQYFYNNYYLAISNIDEFEGHDLRLLSAEIQVKLELAAEKAKTLKENLGALYITELMHPFYTIGGRELQSPTVADPTKTNVLDHYLVVRVKSIWIFDRTTGEVLRKLRSQDHRTKHLLH